MVRIAAFTSLVLVAGCEPDPADTGVCLGVDEVRLERAGPNRIQSLGYAMEPEEHVGELPVSGVVDGARVTMRMRFNFGTLGLPEEVDAGRVCVDRTVLLRVHARRENRELSWWDTHACVGNATDE